MKEIEQIVDSYINQAANLGTLVALIFCGFINYFHRKENRIQNARIKVLENSLKEKESRIIAFEERLAILEKQIEIEKKS